MFIAERKHAVILSPCQDVEPIFLRPGQRLHGPDFTSRKQNVDDHIRIQVSGSHLRTKASPICLFDTLFSC
jgi:hypothetical protein